MAKKKKKAKRKQHSGGEAKKKRADSPRVASQKSKASVADAQDHKRGNIGPSGQGSHRGRERANRQTGVSGRPDVSSAGKKR